MAKGSKKNWMTKAVKRMQKKGTVGDFSEAAKRAGKSTLEYANDILAQAKRYREQGKPLPADLLKKVRQATFAKNAIKVSKKRK